MEVPYGFEYPVIQSETSKEEDAYLEDVRAVGITLPPETPLIDLLPRTSGLITRMGIIHKPIPVWENLYDSLSAHQKSQLASAITAAIKGEYATLADLRSRSKDFLLNPPNDSPHFYHNDLLGERRVTILKTIFEPPPIVYDD